MKLRFFFLKSVYFSEWLLIYLQWIVFISKYRFLPTVKNYSVWGDSLTLSFILFEIMKCSAYSLPPPPCFHSGSSGSLSIILPLCLSTQSCTKPQLAKHRSGSALWTLTFSITSAFSKHHYSLSPLLKTPPSLKRHTICFIQSWQICEWEIEPVLFLH